MGFPKAELETFRDIEVLDLPGDDLRLRCIGSNPGLWTAAAQSTSHTRRSALETPVWATPTSLRGRGHGPPS